MAEAILFYNTVSTMRTVSADPTIHFFTAELLWNSHQSYSGRFFQAVAVKKHGTRVQRCLLWCEYLVKRRNVVI